MNQLVKRLWFWLLLPVAVGGVGLLGFCATYRVWSPQAWLVYRAMENECHPVWRDYHFGRIRAGEPVDDVIALTGPTRVERKGRWVVLHYGKGGEGGISFTGLTAIAYNERMVCATAGSCGWVRLFFDEMSDQQTWEFQGCSKDDPRRFGIVPVYR